MNIALLNAARANNLTILDSHLILEENTKIQAGYRANGTYYLQKISNF